MIHLIIIFTERVITDIKSDFVLDLLQKLFFLFNNVLSLLLKVFSFPIEPFILIINKILDLLLEIFFLLYVFVYFVDDFSILLSIEHIVEFLVQFLLAAFSFRVDTQQVLVLEDLLEQLLDKMLVIIILLLEGMYDLLPVEFRGRFVF